MNGIFGCLNMIGEVLDSKHVDILDSARQSTSELMLIVEAVLVFSELQSGSLSLEHSPFNLKLLCDDLARHTGTTEDHISAFKTATWICTLSRSVCVW